MGYKVQKHMQTKPQVMVGQKQQKEQLLNICSLSKPMKMNSRHWTVPTKIKQWGPFQTMRSISTVLQYHHVFMLTHFIP